MYRTEKQRQETNNLLHYLQFMYHCATALPEAEVSVKATKPTKEDSKANKLERGKRRNLNGRAVIWYIFNLYYRLVIPNAYIYEALEDLKEVIEESNNTRDILHEAYEYTKGSIGFRLTQIEEIYLKGEFHLKNFLGAN